MSNENEKEYWPLPIHGQDRGYRLELRAQLAWDLIHHFGSIAGTPLSDDGQGLEDRSGRNVLQLQSPLALVRRCFTIADLFVEMAEARQELLGYEHTEEEAFVRAGELARVRSRAEYPIGDMPTPEERQARAKARQALREEQAKSGETPKE